MSASIRAEERKAELRASIVEQLKQARSAENRARELADRLREYIDRWSGFAALAHTKAQSLKDGDLFWVIEVATEMMAIEIAEWRPHGPALNLWGRFEEQLGNLPSTDTKDAVRDVVDAFESVHEAIREVPSRR